MPNEVELLQESALADAYALLAVLVDFPDLKLAEGLMTGAVLRDALSIAREAGLGLAWSEAVSRYSGSCAEADDPQELLKAMRIEHTRLFEHPVKPAVFLYEGQFLYEEKLRRENEASFLSLSKLDLIESAGEEGGAGDPAFGRRAGEWRKEDFFDERPRMFVNPAALDAERCYKAAGLRRSDAKNVPGDSMVTELQFMSRLHIDRATALINSDSAALEAVDARIQEFERIHLQKWARAFFEAVNLEARIDAYRLVGKLGAAFFAWRLADG